VPFGTSKVIHFEQDSLESRCFTSRCDASCLSQSVDTAWTAACRRAEIVGLNFHDLRREAGSRLLESGMPEHYVLRFLDHANLSTTSQLEDDAEGDARGAQAHRGAPKPLHNSPILRYR
jgi:integrase